MGMNILATVHAHHWNGAKQERPHDFRRQDLWRINTDIGHESVTPDQEPRATLRRTATARNDVGGARHRRGGTHQKGKSAMTMQKDWFGSVHHTTAQRRESEAMSSGEISLQAEKLRVAAAASVEVRVRVISKKETENER